MIGLRERTEEVIRNLGLSQYLERCPYGLMTPVDRQLIPFAPTSNVVFSSKVADRLMELAKKTQDRNCEYAFVLVGNVIPLPGGERGIAF